MKRKILWMLVSWLIVAAFVLASCGPAVAPGEQEEEEEEPVVPVGEQEEEEEEEEEVVVPAVGEPQYGGTLTALHGSSVTEPRSFDVTKGFWITCWYMNPYLSWVVVGDIEKYGPRGTNEYSFAATEHVPEQYLGGDLAESWEVSEDKIVFHLRHGLMYAGNANIGMEPREITADDVVCGLKHIKEGPLGATATLFVEDIRAEGRYTVIVDTSHFDYLWGAALAYGMGSGMYPPEVIEAGSADWRNQCASGPFMLTNYVKGSVVSFERNPYYYGKTTINGKEYPLPFVDKLVLPIIPDKLTQVASLRTGKIDFDTGVEVQYRDTLAQVPQLNVWKHPGWGCDVVGFQCIPGSGKFTDPEIRRAMMIGLDMQTYVDTLFYGEGLIHSVFSPGTPYYTPMDELPPSTRELYDYDPEKAKRMLAEAGYPNGFKMEMVIKPAIPIEADTAAFIVDQWAKIGVEVTLIPLEVTVHEQVRFSRNFKDAYLRSDAVGAPTELAQRMTECATMMSSWSDPYFDEQLRKARASIDLDEQTAILKAMGVYYIDNCNQINFPSQSSRTYAWPWVKNYYGERETGYFNFNPMFARIWIDQNLKKEMGY